MPSTVDPAVPPTLATLTRRELVERLSDRMLLRNRAWVAGAWIEAIDGATFIVRDPANQAALGVVPQCGAEETRRAIVSAHEAWPAWRARTAADRGAILRRWAEAMHRSRDDLAAIMTAEQGKPLAESLAEIDYAAGFIDWFAEEGKRVYGDLIPAPQAGRRILVTRQSVGVCAAITPWNFPAAMITRKAGAALAAGCTMVVKPAQQTPLSALALAALAEGAGVPAGVLSVVTGESHPIGHELTTNPLVRKLSFTGSTETGKLLARQCAGTLKKLSLELGGNAPFIVFDDADLEAAIEGAIASKFRNSGQTCVCTNRFLVQDGIHDRFAERLARASAALKVGYGFDEGVQQGPLIDAAALAKVESHVTDALARGAQALCGARRHPLGGHWYAPTVLTGCSPAMALAREETFGPVAAIFRFRVEAEAVALANATPYGLAAYLYTRDAGRVFRVAEALECGIVGINTGLISTEVAPFGGIKESGMGREGSRYGIEPYLEMKYWQWAGLGLDAGPSS